MSSRTFALMFEVEDGGVSNPIKWGKDNLKSENIVMVLDEENMAVWLWFGAKRGLVSRRTALRQAQSLKGHGYIVGKSIVGRGLEKIYEIDQRKIGRDSETDALNAKFMELISRSVRDVGGFVVTFGSIGESLPMEEHFEPAKPIEIEIIRPKGLEKPKLEPSETTFMPESVPISNIHISESVSVPVSPPVFSPEPPEEKFIPETRTPPVVASEYTDDIVIPEPVPLKLTSDPMESIQKGCVIMAILSQFKDIWVSRLDGKTVGIEYMDGPIVRFHIEEGKVKFLEDSFKDIDPTVKSNIQSAFYALIDALKK